MGDRIQRCCVCKKRVGVMGFACKCDHEALFCIHHRLPEQHNCGFDHKSVYRQILAKENPPCIPSKMNKV